MGVRIIRIREYEAILDLEVHLQSSLSRKNTPEISEESRDYAQVICTTVEGYAFHLDFGDLNGSNKNLLGLTLDVGMKKLFASSFVGLMPLDTSRKIYLQVLPKMDLLDAARMFVDVVTHPVVGHHALYGRIFSIFPEENPVEVETVPSVYLPMLLFAYLHTLNRLVQRGLQKGYTPRVHTLYGEVRGRILVNATARHHLRGYRNKAEVRVFSHEEDTLENRILYAALKKTENVLCTLGIHHPDAEGFLSRAKQRFAERVTLVRVHPSDVVQARASRIRPDYRTALRLASAILHHFGYDPFGDIHEISAARVFPFWLDMNELFERYTEVMLRRHAIRFRLAGDRREIVNYEVYAGYGHGGGVYTDAVGELRPDFVVISRENNLVMIADAKYKLLYSEDRGSKEELKKDLQQLALYGRLPLSDLLRKYTRGKNFMNSSVCPPYLWILYPDVGQQDPQLWSSLVNMGKVPVRVPLRNRP